ncbi:MAG: HD domain-containing protein [Chloroflexota bacterium]|nr:HD domain-containing protein [Chloroflexota bacterium]
MTQISGIADLAAVLRTMQELKRVKRTGWIDRGVPVAAVESVADHSYLTALIAWMASIDDPALDSDRVLKLAIIHDLAESIVGDAPPYEAHEVPDRSDIDALRAFFSVRHQRSPAGTTAKKMGEHGAFQRLASGMPPGTRSELSSLWAEYEGQATPEARFVKDVDRLEAYLQALHYAEADPDLPLWGFTDMADNEIDHPTLTAIRDASAAPD